VINEGKFKLLAQIKDYLLIIVYLVRSLIMYTWTASCNIYVFSDAKI